MIYKIYREAPEDVDDQEYVSAYRSIDCPWVLPKKDDKKNLTTKLFELIFNK